MRIAWTLTAFLAAALTAGLSGCGDDAPQDAGPGVGGLTMVDKNPTAPAPEIDLPAHLRTLDADLNKFIDGALNTCARGDYEGFRGLFGSAYTPSGRREFERVWAAVARIEVKGLFADPVRPDRYYLHAVVVRRDEDRQGRTARDVVVSLFQEGGAWRMGTAPEAVSRRVREASSQPASEPAA